MLKLRQFWRGRKRAPSCVKNLSRNRGGIQGHSQGDIFPLSIVVIGGTIGAGNAAPGKIEVRHPSGRVVDSVEFFGTESASFRTANAYAEHAAQLWLANNE